MLQLMRVRASITAAVIVLAISASGCTSFRDYVHNSFKVGPNYCKPAAPVAERWIDAPELNSERCEDLARWWMVFQDPVLKQPDPVLNCLVQTAYRQSLTLREAGTRILQARAKRAIAVGGFFPQNQTFNGAYDHLASPISVGGQNIGTSYSDGWTTGMNLNWELDFWGQFRRAIIQADDNLDASVEDYDFVLVTLLGDVATDYLQIRNDQEQIRLLQENVELQRTVVVNYLRPRAKVGFGKDVQIDKDQGESTLASTAAGIPQFEIDLRQDNDALCVLLGMPTVDLREAIPVWKEVDQQKADEFSRVRGHLRELLSEVSELDPENLNPEDREKLGAIVSPIYIPLVPEPKQVAIGIPADLLRRRPDVREAER